MGNKASLAYYADTLSDVLYQVQNISNIKVVGAGTAERVGECFLPVGNVSELCLEDLHERYIDLGAAVTLSRVIALKKTLPDCVVQAAKTIANTGVRNIATIGGNICASGVKHTLYAPLLALDSRLEFHRSGEVQYIRLEQFNGVPKGFVLTKVRIPREEWSLSIFRRIGYSGRPSAKTASWTFLADMDKDIISAVRIAFAGPVVIRARELENNLVGTRLPLTNDIILEYVDYAGNVFDKAYNNVAVPQLLRRQFVTLTAYCLYQLT